MRNCHSADEVSHIHTHRCTSCRHSTATYSSHSNSAGISAHPLYKLSLPSIIHNSQNDQLTWLTHFSRCCRQRWRNLKSSARSQFISAAFSVSDSRRVRTTYCGFTVSWIKHFGYIFHHKRRKESAVGGHHGKPFPSLSPFPLPLSFPLLSLLPRRSRSSSLPFPFLPAPSLPSSTPPLSYDFPLPPFPIPFPSFPLEVGSLKSS